MKKIWRGLGMVLLAITILATTAWATDFADMPDDEYTEALTSAVDNGLLQGYNGYLSPDDALTRAEMTTIMVRAFGGVKEAELDFVDVSAYSWYQPYIAKGVEMGIIQGSGSYMYPEDTMTREEAVLVIARAFQLEAGDVSILAEYDDGSDVSSWAATAVAAMVEAEKFVADDGKLSPLELISRKEFAMIMFRMVDVYVLESGTTVNLTAGTVLVNASNVWLVKANITGDLIVAGTVVDTGLTLSDCTIAGKTILVDGDTVISLEDFEIVEEEEETTSSQSSIQVADDSATLQAMQEEVLELVNQYRAEEGLDPLTLDLTLQAAATIRADEIVEVFSHTRPDGSSCYTAIDEVDSSSGYSYKGENIASGQRSAEAVMMAWMNSSRHKANILKEQYTSLGVGVVSIGLGYAWVQMFGA